MLSDDEILGIYNPKGNAEYPSPLHLSRLRKIEAEAGARALEELAESEFLRYKIDPETGESVAFYQKKYDYSSRKWMRDRADKLRAGVEI